MEPIGKQDKTIICFAHRDKSWADELKTHLMKQKTNIVYWIIDKEQSDPIDIQSAELIICLWSDTFFSRRQFWPFMEKIKLVIDKQIIGVVVAPCNIDPVVKPIPCYDIKDQEFYKKIDVPVPKNSSSLKTDKEIDFFISYSGETHNKANDIYTFFKELGFDVWFAPTRTRLGKEFKEEIDNNIEKCRFVITLWCKNYFEQSEKTNWALYELKKAEEKGKELIPIVIEKNFIFPKEYNYLKKIGYLNIEDKEISDDVKNEIYYEICKLISNEYIEKNKQSTDKEKFFSLVSFLFKLKDSQLKDIEKNPYIKMLETDFCDDTLNPYLLILTQFFNKKDFGCFIDKLYSDNPSVFSSSKNHIIVISQHNYSSQKNKDQITQCNKIKFSHYHFVDLYNTFIPVNQYSSNFMIFFADFKKNYGIIKIYLFDPKSSVMIIQNMIRFFLLILGLLKMIPIF